MEAAEAKPRPEPEGARLSWRLTVLSVLYFVQGLPYGFQVGALPLLLRQEGVSLAEIGIASWLSLPWMIKVIWGPPIDRWGSERFGRRRSWILPLQIAMTLAALLAAPALDADTLVPLVLVVLVSNLLASTLDVAVDGLAVEILRDRELGVGNIAQVVGYKVGILVGGGLLVLAVDRVGWTGLFMGLGALTAAAAAFTLAWREEDLVERRRTPERPTFGEIWRQLRAALAQPGTGWLLLFIATYKTGESMADTMLRPFLLDAGLTASQIGGLVGTWGMVFSIAGSFAGGILASRRSLLSVVGFLAALRAVTVGLELWLVAVGPTVGRVAFVTASEQFFGGALTTAMFAFMMSRVVRRIGATHYTLLAMVEVLGKVSAASLSGWLAAELGYLGLYALATGLAIGFLVLLIPLGRTPPPRLSSPPASPPPGAMPLG